MNRMNADTGLPAETIDRVEWKIDADPVPYPEAITFMERRVADIRAGSADELVWLLEHPPLYTAGSSASEDELIDKERFPVFPTGRGGRYTYHGPGQRVAYVMLDLQRRGPDVRRFIRQLECWIIDTLEQFGIVGEPRADRIGIWVTGPDGREAKIAAIGVRIRRWVTFHGIALNVSTNLEHFQGIVPCGIDGFGVTSMQELGIDANLSEIDESLQQSFTKIFS